jgi:hypothetical protein
VTKLSDIVIERSPYWVKRTAKGYFEIYRNGVTHSTRCAVIGFAGEEGLRRVNAEIDRRIAADLSLV